MIFASLQTVQCQNHHANQWQHLFHLPLESFSLTHHNPILSHQTFTLHNVLNAACVQCCRSIRPYLHHRFHRIPPNHYRFAVTGSKTDGRNPKPVSASETTVFLNLNYFSLLGDCVWSNVNEISFFLFPDVVKHCLCSYYWILIPPILSGESAQLS